MDTHQHKRHEQSSSALITKRHSYKSKHNHRPPAFHQQTMGAMSGRIKTLRNDTKNKTYHVNATYYLTCSRPLSLHLSIRLRLSCRLNLHIGLHNSSADKSPLHKAHITLISASSDRDP